MNVVLLVAAVLAGVLGAFAFPAKGKGIKYFTAFSGGFLLSISFLELIPESYEALGSSLGGWLLGGFFFQIVLDYFSQGAEHGHIHYHEKDKGRTPYLLLFSLCLHAFLEGMPVNHGHDLNHGHGLLWGVVVHKIPVALILFQFLRIHKLSNLRIAIIMTLFAFMSPAGALIADYLPGLSEYLPQIRAVVLGVFLHIATTILYESSESHRFNGLKLFAVILGLTAGWLSILF